MQILNVNIFLFVIYNIYNYIYLFVIYNFKNEKIYHQRNL